MNPIITLTTDFGLDDAYVAAVKGVILGLCEDARLVDVTHLVAPQDVHGGAYHVSTLVNLYPAGTVHLAVVDPGVGSSRKPLLVATKRDFYIGPDNGVLTPALNAAKDVREIANPSYRRESVSATFHGRDIFAPAAAYLASGVPPSEFGPVVSDPVHLERWAVSREGDVVRGHVVHIDRFGSAITNIGRHLIEGDANVVIVRGEAIGPIVTTYADVGVGERLALIGSQETVEISINGGSAVEKLGLRRGDAVDILPG